MRIVSGKYKGRHIPVRHNFPSRPTTDFAKENLFNVLGNHFDFEGLHVLDLFAGTGSIGYEFASRGAIVDQVEKDYRSYQFIRTTIVQLKMENIKPYKADVFRVLPRWKKAYDIVFADPPYQMKYITDLPDLVFSGTVLKPGGWFILEHSDQVKMNSHRYFREVREYGSVNFSVFVQQLMK